MKRIGYLGPAGTFTEEALRRYVDAEKPAHIAVSANSFFELFRCMETGDCDEIVVPVENSIEGSVNMVLDLLSKSNDITVSYELVLPITHALLALPGTKPAEVTTVMSHPQALAQCQAFLRRQLPQARLYQASSTAMAAQMCINGELKEENGNKEITAVIGNRALAGIYNLEILMDEVNDVKNNKTRFLVLSREKTQPTGRDKTSLIFSTKKDLPGSLVNVLLEFSNRNINLTEILSRPSQNELGEYIFFLDCEGHILDPLVAEALEAIQSKTSWLKILGSYPRA